MKKAHLVLSDGSIYHGISFGFEGESFGEVVFNTSITGYQEILTDPSYHGQIVVMTYPHIGNYGIADEDMESERPHVAGFIVRSYSEIYSNWRAKESLADFLIRNRIAAGTGFDTRTIVRHIRDKGAMPALLIVGDVLPGDTVARAASLPTMSGQDLASQVTCKEKEVFPTYERTNALTRQIVLYDFGVKLNIIRMLQLRCCNVTVVPADTSAEAVIAMKPDGIVLSNGPGYPAAVTYAIENIRALLGRFPIFGICLGHQLLALALGGKTYKLKFGHRGANQPVLNLNTGRVEITSQNHGFAVDANSLIDANITHINLNDKTVEGLRAKKFDAFSVQYHPEASPGPHDSNYLFDEFLKML